MIKNIDEKIREISKTLPVEELDIIKIKDVIPIKLKILKEN